MQEHSRRNSWGECNCLMSTRLFAAALKFLHDFSQSRAMTSCNSWELRVDHEIWAAYKGAGIQWLFVAKQTLTLAVAIIFQSSLTFNSKHETKCMNLRSAKI